MVGPCQRRLAMTGLIFGSITTTSPGFVWSFDDGSGLNVHRRSTRLGAIVEQISVRFGRIPSLTALALKSDDSGQDDAGLKELPRG